MGIMAVMLAGLTFIIKKIVILVIIGTLALVTRTASKWIGLLFKELLKTR